MSRNKQKKWGFENGGSFPLIVQFTEEHAFKLRCHTEEQKSSPWQGLSVVLSLQLFNAKNISELHYRWKIKQGQKLRLCGHP